MNAIIYGFETVIAAHRIQEIFLFLFVYAIMLLLIGRMVEKQAVQLHYMQLLRFQGYRRWWYRVWTKVLAFAVGMVCILFLGMGLISNLFQRNDFQDGVVCPLVLWCVHMCAVASFLALMGSLRRGFYLSFFVAIGVQIFSMYSGLYMEKIADYLPGSYVMVRRTQWQEGAMPVWLLILIEGIWILSVGICGYRLYRRRDN